MNIIYIHIHKHTSAVLEPIAILATPRTSLQTVHSVTNNIQDLDLKILLEANMRTQTIEKSTSLVTALH